jgi:hypothetical protein
MRSSPFSTCGPRMSAAPAPPISRALSCRICGDMSRNPDYIYVPNPTQKNATCRRHRGPPSDRRPCRAGSLGDTRGHGRTGCHYPARASPRASDRGRHQPTLAMAAQERTGTCSPRSGSRRLWPLGPDGTAPLRRHKERAFAPPRLCPRRSNPHPNLP